MMRLGQKKKIQDEEIEKFSSNPRQQNFIMRTLLSYGFLQQRNQYEIGGGEL